MANRNFPASRVFGFNLMPVRISGNVILGSSGAVTSFSGQGIQGITRLAAGTYRIQLSDNYSSFIGWQAAIQSPVTGSNVAVTAVTPGVAYQITVLGTTTTAQWVTAGLPAGVAPAVGQAFVAAATSLGTGQVKAMAVSGINCIEVLGDPQQMLQTQPFIQNVSGGSYVTIRTLGPTDASTTTQIAKDPVTLSAISFSIMMNNSSIQ